MTLRVCPVDMVVRGGVLMRGGSNREMRAVVCLPTDCGTTEGRAGFGRCMACGCTGR
ncbi:hypothetical protein GCM10010496_64230 [Streptomyces asoensis]|nr:hypothetical protein GCM10010496_64230 [Streptomyces asoensis]